MRIVGKGFAIVDEIDDNGKASSRVGGRIDATKTFNDVKFIGSFSDTTLKELENSAKLPDAVITAEKKVNDNLSVTAGYDAGTYGALLKANVWTNVAKKAVSASAMWFQRGDHIRGEAKIQLNANSYLWAAHTLNDKKNIANSTFVNLQEREQFVIKPFIIPIATSAIKYGYSKNDYTFEVAADLKEKKPYLTLKKDQGKYAHKVEYALKEETVLYEFGYRKNLMEKPVVKGFLRGNLGQSGVGSPSVGVLVEHAIDFS